MQTAMRLRKSELPLSKNLLGVFARFFLHWMKNYSYESTVMNFFNRQIITNT